MHIIDSYLFQYGYWILFLGIFLEDFGMPFPGETALIAGGILAGKGDFSIVLVLLITFAGAVLGDNLGYAIGRFGGHRLLVRYGKYLFINEKKLSQAETFFHRYGSRIVVLARFVSGLRQLNGIIAGALAMHWRRFIVYNMLGAALWTGAWGMAAYFMGRHAHTVLATVKKFEAVFFILLAVCLLLYALIRYIRHIRNRNRSEP
jgi:membrane protein DedA with SNARE-associated domain